MDKVFVRAVLVTVGLVVVGCSQTLRQIAEQTAEPAVEEGLETTASPSGAALLREILTDPKLKESVRELSAEAARSIVSTLSEPAQRRHLEAAVQFLLQVVLQEIAYQGPRAAQHLLATISKDVRTWLAQPEAQQDLLLLLNAIASASSDQFEARLTEVLPSLSHYLGSLPFEEFMADLTTNVTEAAVRETNATLLELSHMPHDRSWFPPINSLTDLLMVVVLIGMIFLGVVTTAMLFILYRFVTQTGRTS